MQALPDYHLPICAKAEPTLCPTPTVERMTHGACMVEQAATAIYMHGQTDYKHMRGQLQGEFVEVGTVAGAFGVNGEVRVKISTDNPSQRFAKRGNTLFLRAPKAGGLMSRTQTGGEEQGMIKVGSIKSAGNESCHVTSFTHCCT